MNKIKRILALMLVMLLVFTMVPDSRVAYAVDPSINTMGKTGNELKQKSEACYQAELRFRGYYSYEGLCGTQVGDALYILGITAGYEGGNGNDYMGIYSGQTVTSGGYGVKTYPCSNATQMEQILNQLTNNGTKNIWNIVMTANRTNGSTAGNIYGHVIFISGIVGGQVYWVESYPRVGESEGTCVVRSIHDFCSIYAHMDLAGIIKFTDTVDGDIGGSGGGTTPGTNPGTDPEPEKPKYATQPTNVRVTKNGHNITINWDRSANATGYTVDVIGGGNLTKTLNTKSTSASFTNLDFGNYKVTVQARPAEGDAKSNPVSVNIDSHNRGNSKVISQPTCSVPGSRQFTCTVCGHTVTEPIPATGEHSFTVGTDENGKMVWKCHMCGYIKGTQDNSGNTTPFSDISSSSWSYKAIEWAVNNHITSGTSTNTFSPTQNCSRAEVVTFIWKLNGSPYLTGIIPYSDVPKSAYYYPAVVWAYKRNIVNGVSPTRFDPNATCTRAEAVALLQRALGYYGDTDLTKFSDVPETAWFASAVAWAVENDVTKGTGDNKFDPYLTCTREQVVTFLYRTVVGES